MIKWNIVSLQIDVMTFKINANKIIWFWNISNKFVAKTYAKTCVGTGFDIHVSYRDIDDEPVDEDEDNEIEEEEINTALKKVLILLDQVNDLSKSAK